MARAPRRRQEATPAYATPRTHSRRTWGPRVGQTAKALGKKLLPWQQELADLALEVGDDDHLAYRQVVVTVPRQSGKSTLVMAKNIQRMIDASGFGGRQNLVYVAQSRKDAKAKLMDDWVPELEASRRMDGRWTVRRSAGEEAIRWQNGSLWTVQANKEHSGHGRTIDVGDVDEAFSLKDDRVEQALSPAMITRRDAQLWIVSTAGTETSFYLKEKVAAGRASAQAGVTEGIAYVEFSAPEGADLDDEQGWFDFMPALGYTTRVEAIRSERAAMTQQGFARAYGNLWVPSTYGAQVIEQGAWERCLDAGSEIAEGEQLVFALDVAPNSTWASIAVAGLRSDGLPHVEVVQNDAGDDWVADRVEQLLLKHGGTRRTPLYLDPVSPAGGLLPELRSRGIEAKPINATALTQACASLKQRTMAGTWRHIGQDRLDDALKGAATRQVGDAWAWKRKGSSLDISPLVAVTIALHGLGVEPRRRELSHEELLAGIG